MLPYNDREAVAAPFAADGDQIACLITEAAAGNMGVVPPEPGFNQFLAETCAAHGALFVSDEVMTGFRASRTGQWGLDGAVEGWTPDLMTFGKVMGGGFPAAAFGGRADVMADAVAGGAGLPGGHVVGEPDRDDRRPGHAAAGHRRRLRPPRPRSVRRSRRLLRRRCPPRACRTRCSRPARCSPSSSPRGRSATSTAAQRQDTAAFAAFFHAMLDHGVYLPPSAYEAWFVSAAHDERAVQTVLDALPPAAHAAAQAAATAREGTHG